MHGSFNELIVNGVNGYKVDTSQAEEIVKLDVQNAIKKAQKIPPQQIEQFYENNFTSDIITSLLLRLMEKQMQAQESGAPSLQKKNRAPRASADLMAAAEDGV